MRGRILLYALVGAAALGAAVIAPLRLFSAGSSAVPRWAEAVLPGPLSKAHEFIGARCESCHVPLRGVEATGCLTCHAADAPQLTTRPSTAFHTDIASCAGCHVEHLGRDRRPINMDHAVLVRAGHDRLAASAAAGTHADTLNRIRRLLSEGLASLGDPVTRPGRALPSADATTLACGACHVNQDPHRTLFGTDCQACHSASTWTVSAFRHPSPRSQDCSQCHQAPPSHYMMHFTMDQMITGQRHARVEQCYLCHQTDAWNNIRGIGWYKHH